MADLIEVDDSKWYHPKLHMGWKKTMPLLERRTKAYEAHGQNLLETGRALLALANVTEDVPTARIAKRDSTFFFTMNRRMKQAQQQGQKEVRQVERQVRRMKVRLTRGR